MLIRTSATASRLERVHVLYLKIHIDTQANKRQAWRYLHTPNAQTIHAGPKFLECVAYTILKIISCILHHTFIYS
jgi:hypothetical protein